MDRERVLRCDEPDPVRTCAECSRTARVENAFEEQHAPFLLAGGLFDKHGMVRMRRVFVSLAPDHRHILYQSADPRDRADVKKILVFSITAVELVSSHTVQIVAGDRDHLFDAPSELMASQWLRALECLVQLVAIPEPWNARRSAGRTPESGLYGNGSPREYGGSSQQVGTGSQNERPAANPKSKKWSKNADRIRAKYAVRSGLSSGNGGLSTRDLNGMR